MHVTRPVGSAALMLLLAMGATQPTVVPAQDLEVEVDGIGYVLGDSTAPVEIVEFGDFACSACAEFWRETWPRARTQLVETGRVRWRHVPFVIGFARSDEGANAAECAADQGHFWAMHDRLFGGQAEWSRMRRPKEVYIRYAQELGLDSQEFGECYDEERSEDRTDAATRAAERAGVRGTPTFFINGKRALGALSFEMFLGLVEEAEAEPV